MRWLLVSLVACSSKREPPPPPPLPPIVADAASTIAPGTILRKRKLDFGARSIVVTPNAIYYAELRTGVYMLRNDVPVPLDQHFAWRIVSDGEAIYYLASAENQHRLVRHPFGGEPTELDHTLDGFVQAVDDTHVYIVTEKTTTAKVPKTGGEPLTLPCMRRLAVDQDALYCIEDTALVRYDKQGQGRTVLASVNRGFALSEGPVVTDRYVYASTIAAPPADYQLVRVVKDGSQPLEIVTDVGLVADMFVVDGREVYWAETRTHASQRVIVRRIADTDTHPTDFADGFGNPRSIFVGPSTVFVSDSEYPGIIELAR